MKRERVVWGIATSLTAWGLWGAHHFQQEYKALLDKNCADYLSLKKEKEKIKKDVSFLKKSQKEIEYLKKKGWFQPKSRLIAGSSLEEINHSLNKFNYIFKPETIKQLEDKYTFIITQITIDVEARLDTDIYNFIERVIEKFSGIVKLTELTLKRNTHNAKMVVGKLNLEWVAMGSKKNE